ncbi:MAG TPA: hypothetical protein VII64_12940 [Thermodesulfobacteriota bacterium]
MERRGGDYICILAGSVLLAFALVALAFPEVSYVSREAAGGLTTEEFRVIVIPRPVSVAAGLIAVALFYNCRQIRRRGSA